MAPRRVVCSAVALALAARGALAGEGVALQPHPPCRKSPEFHSLTWPDGSDRLVAFGGKGFSWRHKKHHRHKKHAFKEKVQMFGDTWGFDGDDLTWMELGQAGEASPSSRWKPSSCTVDGSKAFVLFGGDHITDISGVLQDLWVFRTANEPGLGHWTQVHTENVPRNRRGHILEASSTHLLIMGGKTFVPGTNGVVLTDLWTIPLAALEPGSKGLSWTRGADFPGEPRWGATGTVIKDAKGDEVMAVFGGRHLNAGGGFHSTAANAYTYYNELYLHSFKDGSWTKPEIKGDKPCKRDHHGASDLNGDLWVFGGRTSEARTADAVVNDLWSFSLSTMSWTLHPSTGITAPSARFMPGVAGTTFQGKPAVAVFAGESLPGSTKKTSMNDLWYYVPSSKNTGEWNLAAESECSAAAVVPDAFVEEEMLAGPPMLPFLAVAVAFAVGAVFSYQKRGKSAAFGTEADSEQPYVAIE